MALYARNFLTGVTRDTALLIVGRPVLFLRLYFAAFAVLLGLDAATIFFGRWGDTDQAGAVTDESFSELVVLEFLYALPIGFLAIAIHRSILAPSQSPVPSAATFLMFWGLSLVESLVLQLPIRAIGTDWAADFLGPVSQGLALISALVFAIALSTRLVTVFPHVAVTPRTRLNLKSAARLSGGAFSSIFVRLLRIGATFLFVTWSLRLAAEMTIEAPFTAGIVISEFLAEILYDWPIRMLGLAMFMFFVVLASLIYRRLSSLDPELKILPQTTRA